MKAGMIKMRRKLQGDRTYRRSALRACAGGRTRLRRTPLDTVCRPATILVLKKWLHSHLRSLRLESCAGCTPAARSDLRPCPMQAAPKVCRSKRRSAQQRPRSFAGFRVGFALQQSGNGAAPEKVPHSRTQQVGRTGCRHAKIKATE